MGRVESLQILFPFGKCCFSKYDLDCTDIKNYLFFLILYVYIWNLENGTDETIFRAGIELQTSTTDLWTAGEGEGGTNGESSFGSYTLPI